MELFLNLGWYFFSKIFVIFLLGFSIIKLIRPGTVKRLWFWAMYFIAISLMAWWWISFWFESYWLWVLDRPNLKDKILLISAIFSWAMLAFFSHVWIQSKYEKNETKMHIGVFMSVVSIAAILVFTIQYLCI